MLKWDLGKILHNLGLDDLHWLKTYLLYVQPLSAYQLFKELPEMAEI